MPTQEQKDNLRKLAEYLKQPVLKAKFSMSTFDETEGGGWCSLARQTCGTVGCAVGHGPYATGILKEVGEGWEGYCKRVFGAVRGAVDDFNFMFSWEWGEQGHSKTMSAEQAARRIEYYLQFGTPVDWTYTSIY